MTCNMNWAEPIRPELGGIPFVEKKMFGGIGFLIHGNMVCGVSKEDMIVRVNPEKQEKHLEKPYAKPFPITGQPRIGWLAVEPEGCKTNNKMSAWVKEGLEFSLTRPAK